MIFKLCNEKLSVSDLLPMEYNDDHEKGRVLYANINYDSYRLQKADGLFARILRTPTYENIESLVFGGFFIVICNTEEKTLQIFRDRAGIKTGYFTRNADGFFFGTNQHEIAKFAKEKGFNPLFCSMLININFIPDGKTIYQDVFEFKMGSDITLDFKGNILKEEFHPLNFATEDNALSEEENCKKLRETILNAHANLISRKNIIYLSGGIDSCVIAAALKEVAPAESLSSVTYRIRHTTQDEVPYARSLASYLKIPNEVRDVDPSSEAVFDDYEQRILASNSPYIGMWEFKPEGGGEDSVWFAGQDTRLHTPALNQIDKLAVRLVLNKNIRVLSHLTAWINDLYQPVFRELGLWKAKNPYLRFSDHIPGLLDPERYVRDFIFKLNPTRMKLNFPENAGYFADMEKYYVLDYSKIRNPRDFYNKVVRVRWGLQYTDDIHYMQDMGTLAGTCVQMPFYDVAHAEFSSSIPYALATKFFSGRTGFTGKRQRINKYVLRKAFQDELNEKTQKRAKAVSNTVYLLFNGALRPIISKVLSDDLKSDTSFIREYQYEQMATRFLDHRTEWGMGDFSFLMGIYFLFVICIYNKHLYA